MHFSVRGAILRAVEPHPDASPVPPAPSGGKSALAFFAVVAALYLPGAIAQTAQREAGLAWTEVFAFLVPALVATAGSNLRADAWLRLRPTGPVPIAVGALVGAAGYLVAGAVVTLTQQVVPERWVQVFDPGRLFHGPLWERALFAAIAVVLAPPCEEIAFRGYVQSALLLRHRPAGAIVGAALLFAALHLNPVLFPALLLLGIVFGWLTWRAGSLWPAVAAHAVNNGITSALVLTVGAPKQEPVPPAAIAASLALGSAALSLLLLAYRAATPRSPPAGVLALRDPADPSIRFSPARVGPRLKAFAYAGAVLLAAVVAAGALVGPRRIR